MFDGDVWSSGHGDAWEVLVHETADGTTVVRMCGEFDVSNAVDLCVIGRQVFSASTAVVVDLSGVTFMDGAGLRALLQMLRLAASLGRPLKLSDVSPGVHRVLELTGLLSILSAGVDQHPSRERG